MQEVLTIALQSMHHDMARLERVGINLANALTPGYKRDVVAVSPSGNFPAMKSSSFEDLVNAGNANLSVEPNGPVKILSDLRSGTLRSTGQSLDLALAGPGYFEIQTPEGPAYTRQGTFRLDGRGKLVTAQGDPVMGLSGEIVLPNATPSIDATGRIFDRTVPGVSDSSPVAQLKIVRFQNPQLMQRLGNGLFAGKGEPLPVTDPALQVRQAYLENSNVNSMQEMVQMIQTMRHFESMQKVALGYDEMIGTAVRKLGELS
jgi:flagellar basal-body rod protein FlgF